MAEVPGSQAQQAKVQLISPPRPPRRLKHPTPPLRAPPRPPTHTLLPAHLPLRALASALSSPLPAVRVHSSGPRGLLGVPQPPHPPPPSYALVPFRPLSPPFTLPQPSRPRASAPREPYPRRPTL